MRAAWPATRSAHSFLEFRLYPLNVLPSGFRFLDGDNPADPFIAREWRNAANPSAGLSDMAAAKTWAASTYNHYRSLLMLTYREARRSGKVSTNPARDIRHRKENNGRVRFLSRGDKGEYARLAKIILEKDPEHYAEFVVALNTGLRLSSQYGATYGMIDWTRNVLDIPRTKNDESVHVPLNNDVLAALRSVAS